MAGHSITNATTGPAIRRLVGWTLLLALVLLAVGRSHLGTRLDSFTIDEAWHVVAGTSYVRTGDWRLNPEHPPLVKVWVGAFMPPSLLVLRPFEALVDKEQERDYVDRIVHLDNDAVAVQQRARLAMYGLHAVLLLLLGGLAWRAFGLAPAAGLLGLLALEPTFSAHLPLVMTDSALALTLAIAALAAGAMVDGWRWRWVLATGGAMGLALAAKHSALPGLLALGLGLVVVAAWTSRREGWSALGTKAGKLVLVAALAVAVLWASYGFRFHTSPDGSDPFNRPMADKIEDLGRPSWRLAIGFADQHRLLPRPYLWGLADTVRAGVDGRMNTIHRIWRREYEGRAPLHAWPSIIASKLPLTLLVALPLAAIVLVRTRTRTTAAAGTALGLVLLVAGAHLAALLSADSAYAGIRHALPVVVAVLTVIALGLVAIARRQRTVGVAVALAMLVAIGLETFREPRLWEFHNRLAGGTAEAWRQFSNEGIDLGQRFHELHRFATTVAAPEGAPFWLGVWRRESEGQGGHFRRWVESLDDDNVEGIWEGYFAMRISATRSDPRWNWDAEAFFAELVMVERFGMWGVWKGRVVDPKTRASGLAGLLWQEIYLGTAQDWALIATRAEEVLAVMPEMVPGWLELGNARLRLGDADAAVAAYRRFLDQDRMPIPDPVRAAVESHIEAVQASPDPARMTPLRNPFLE